MLGALAVLGDLCEVAGQHSDDLVDLRARIVAQRSNGGRRRLLQLIEQFDREASEVVDEVERVLDLVGDAGGELPECGHLLRVHQAGLRALQFTRAYLDKALQPLRCSSALGKQCIALGGVIAENFEGASHCGDFIAAFGANR